MRSEPLADPDYLDFKATITTCVIAVVLSVRRFQGVEMDALYLTYDTWPHEPWRLLTACMLHGGWMHLVFNVLWTFQLGRILEPVLGWPAMAGLMVFLGATSSAAQFAFSGGGIGLSGIVYGLFGVLWVLSRYHPRFRGVMREDTAWWLLGWFFLCIVMTEYEVMNIANVAHGAGAVFGALVGWTMTPLGLSKARAWSALIMLTLTVGLASTVGRPYVNFSESRAWELQGAAFKAFEAEDFERAAGLLQQAVELDDEDPDTWHNLCVIYQRLEAWELAAEAYQRSVALGGAESEPDSSSAPLGPFQLERERR